ncbi:MAG: hypothetical protein KKH68_05915 [Proteobacteria bacterium]|nr:hypothetical protein [Pseudomonadota bacterium]
MFKSIKKTRKLFEIEGVKTDGQVNIKTSRYLLSLPKAKQSEVLNTHLANLKKDLAIFENPVVQNSIGEGGYINKAQLQLLIQVIEGLLAKI